MQLYFQTAGSARRALTVLLSGLLLAGMGGCSMMPSWASVGGDKVLGLVRPYRVEVVQGNVLTKELVARIKPGMTRPQVRDALGSPLLTDVFHDDRWDYVFTIRRQGTEPQMRQVVAWFDGDKLRALEAPTDLPTEAEFVASIDTTKLKGNAPKLDLSDTERQAIPKPNRPAPPTPEAVGPVRSYPPLEPQS